MARARKTPTKRTTKGQKDEQAATGAQEGTTDDTSGGDRMGAEQTPGISEGPKKPQVSGEKQAGADDDVADLNATAAEARSEPADTTEAWSVTTAKTVSADSQGSVDEVAPDGESSKPGPADGAAVETRELDEIERPVADAQAKPRMGPPPIPPSRGVGAGGVAALILGGVIAAGLGVAAARLIFPEGWPGQSAATEAAIADVRGAVESQSARIDSVDDAVAGLASSLAALEAAQPRIDDLSSSLESGLADADRSLGALSERLDAAESRITDVTTDLEALAMRPMPEGLDTSSIEAEVDRFRNELSAAVEAARGEIVAAQREAEEIRAAAADEAAQREAEAAQRAADMEAEALAEADAATRRAAMARVLAAIENGDPYAQHLALLPEAPSALAGPAAEGVPTLVELQQSFPDAARAALDASIRAEAGGGTMDRLTAFLRVQSGVRSLEPKEGDDPDAVLSRAEAAIRAGDIELALAELEDLPESGKKTIADWATSARTRLDALSAAKSLSEQLTTN